MKQFKWLLLLVVFALVAAACGDDAADETTAAPSDTTAATTAAPSDDGGTDTTAAPATTEAPASLEGTSVTLFGPESSEEEAGAMQDALDVFAAESGIEITYTGARDFSDQINAQAVGGNPPDIAVFPQPGKIGDFANEDLLQPIPQAIVDKLVGEWPAGTFETATFNGSLYGMPNKTDLKSVVWYNTSIFADGGYTVPTSWDDLLALSDTMVADGVTPWCVGIESGPATGWTFTDWMEELVLRLADENVYDQWVAHEIPFNDPQILAIGEAILDLWTDDNVFAAGGSIAATPFGDNGTPLAAGDCAMHRQASFFAAFMPETAVVGPGGDIDVFYFPSADDRTPVLTAGTYVSAFRDAPEVWAVIEYMGSAQYSEERQKAQAARKGGGQSGYLSANLAQDLSVYNDLEKSFVEILQTASPARFDGSDLMPAAVGAGSFWTEATSAVNGDKTIAEALDAIDASWPTE